ncbi:hypothetical protein [Rubrivivax sp. A210]|nr:hypothetical protein [Rubrivivax sp. A210]
MSKFLGLDQVVAMARVILEAVEKQGQPQARLHHHGRCGRQ